MLLRRTRIISLLVSTLALQLPAQEKSPAKPAAPVAASPVDTIIQLVKGGMPESLVIKTLRGQNEPVKLTPVDMLKLQKSGVSAKIIDAMMDPSAGAAPTPAVTIASVPSPAPPPGPVAAAAPKEGSVGAACPMPAAVSQVAGSQKRRLAVSAFDYSTVKTQVTAAFNNDVNIGQGIRAMLTAKMGPSKTVVLLEREKLAQLETEQDKGATNRFAQGPKAKIGKLVGADAMLFGDIVIFGRDDTGKRNGAAGFMRGVPLVGGVANAKKTDKAVVAINLRLVDAETGEVIETGEARGESSRTSTDWGAIAGSWRGAAAGSSGMTSSNFQETIIGEATADAVTKIVAFIEQKIPQIGPKSRTIEGRVANFDGCSLYITVGGNDGVQVGDRFEIHKILNEVNDPETKEVLDQRTVKVGEFVVSTVRDKVSIGQYGGEPLSPTYPKGYAARLAAK